MNQEQFTAVDRYLEHLFIGTDDALEHALRASAEAGLPPISVSPTQGKLLMLLAHMSGAQRILEIGTLGGYSTIWLARALPADGQLISLEYDPKHAVVARGNLDYAGLSNKVTVREGRALDTLPQLVAENIAPFDFCFIDADKEAYTDYLDWAIRLARPGTVIVADNVVREGAVIDAKTTNSAVQGAQRFNAALAAEPRVTATAVQLVGTKGYDGIAIAVVK